MKIKLLFLLILATSCINKNKKDYFEVKKNINYQQVDTQIDEKKNISPSDSIKQSFLDTLNSRESPVKVISSQLLKNQYSDHKDIRLIYKNISKKRIGAIRFEWYCENAFNKPASGKFFFVQGKAEGETHTMVNPGKIKSHIWEDFSTDAQSIVSIRAAFVAFTDGTSWSLK